MALTRTVTWKVLQTKNDAPLTGQVHFLLGPAMVSGGGVTYVRDEHTVTLRITKPSTSILGALSNVSMVGRDGHLASEFFFSASRVPALKVDEFHFSSVSDH